jgi:hypothetical protein
MSERIPDHSMFLQQHTQNYREDASIPAVYIQRWNARCVDHGITTSRPRMANFPVTPACRWRHTWQSAEYRRIDKTDTVNYLSRRDHFPADSVKNTTQTQEPGTMRDKMVNNRWGCGIDRKASVGNNTTCRYTMQHLDFETG